MKGVWDGLDKDRISRAVVTAFTSDEYLELLARINNAETPAEVEAARQDLKEVMSVWREECPEYAFMVDCLYLFSEKAMVYLTREGQ